MHIGIGAGSNICGCRHEVDGFINRSVRNELQGRAAVGRETATIDFIDCSEAVVSLAMPVLRCEQRRVRGLLRVFSVHWTEN